MPDSSNLQINVQTTADLSGLQQVRTEINGINADIQKQLSAAGAAFDPVTNSFKSVTAETQALNTAWTLTGGSMGKARGEATVLARELATGTVQARTMGALLGALGTPIAIAAIAAIALNKIFDAIAASIIGAAKQQAEFNTKLAESVKQWAEMARYVRSLGDEVRLAEKIGKDLDKLAADMEKFRSEQLNGFQRFWDAIAPKNNPFFGTFAGAKQEEVARRQEELNTAVQAANTEVSVAEDKWRDYAAAVANLDQGISDYGHKVQQLTEQLQKLDEETAKNPTNKSLFEQRQQTLKDLQETTRAYQDLIKDQEQLNAAAKKEDRRDVLALLREEETILQNIRQQQELTKANPFLSADDKSNALITQYVAEMAQLQSIITAINAEKAKGPLDPLQEEQINQKLQQTNFEFDLLRLKVIGLQQPLQSTLVNWVNSWGTAAHQIGGFITNSIDESLRGVNTLLTDAIFRTGNWRQTLQGVESQIISLFLTFLEHMALQKAAQLLGITTTNGAVVASNTAIAASSAPAAAGTSIASYGSSALVGESTALAAIAAIEGALVAHQGGPIPTRRMHSGGLAPDEVPIIAQEGEFMVRREIAQQILPFLMALNAGALFHGGGGIRRLHEGGSSWEPGDPLDPGGPPVWGSGYNPSLPMENAPFDSPDPNFEPTPIPFTPSHFVDTNPDAGDLIGASDFGPTNAFISWGFLPSIGTPGFLQGPTMIPTTFDPQGYPYAVPASFDNPTDPVGLFHEAGGAANFHPKHGGGPIGRFHLGGSIGSLPIMRAPRFHSGGSIGSVSQSTRPQIHINNYTDLKTLVKEMASQKGRRIIIDTVRGHRIDLGI